MSETSFHYTIENIIGEDIDVDIAGWTIITDDGYNHGALFFTSISEAEHHIHDLCQAGEENLSAYALRRPA